MTLIRPTRREILRLAAIAPGFALPAMARAELGRPAAPNPTHFRFTMGEARLTVISDGFFMCSRRVADACGRTSPRTDVDRPVRAPTVWSGGA